MDWVLLALYVVVAVPVWRRAAYLLAHDVASGKPTGFDIGMSLFIGSFAAMFWPFAVVGYFLWSVSKDGHGFLKEPRTVKSRDERIRELEERNGRLERELGLR